MNLRVFFDGVRPIFGGTLAQSQVEGMENILRYRDTRYSGVTNDQLAYMLATAYWETAHTMQPVTEYGSQAYLRAKKYWPWIGRGLVQLTWKDNFAKFGITNPEDALKWDKALYIFFRGMVEGMFTGKKLSDYITDTKRDYVNARRIINGVDKASTIAAIANKFRTALIAAAKVPADVVAHEDKGVFEEIGEFFNPTPTPPPVKPPIHQATGDMLSIALAIAAAAGAMQQANWVEILGSENPRVGLTMVAISVAIAVSHVFLPHWMQPITDGILNRYRR